MQYYTTSHMLIVSDMDQTSGHGLLDLDLGGFKFTQGSPSLAVGKTSSTSNRSTSDSARCHIHRQNYIESTPRKGLFAAKYLLRWRVRQLGTTSGQGCPLGGVVCSGAQ